MTSDEEIEWSAYDEPEMQVLCAKQIQELSAVTARHAQDRIVLALRIKRDIRKGKEVL